MLRFAAATYVTPIAHITIPFHPALWGYRLQCCQEQLGMTPHLG